MSNITDEVHVTAEDGEKYYYPSPEYFVLIVSNIALPITCSIIASYLYQKYFAATKRNIARYLYEKCFARRNPDILLPEATIEELTRELIGKEAGLEMELGELRSEIERKEMLLEQIKALKERKLDEPSSDELQEMTVLTKYCQNILWSHGWPRKEAREDVVKAINGVLGTIKNNIEKK